MLSRVYTATTQGLSAIKIEVEVDTTQGVPGFHIIGLPSKAVAEAKERISAAISNCGVPIKARRTVVNLAPADMPKNGSAFELAIAVGLLKQYGLIHFATDNTLFLGELSLDGSLKAIKGALPILLAARTMGYSRVVFPEQNYAEVAVVTECELVPIAHLSQVLHTTSLTAVPTQTPHSLTDQPLVDMAEIAGQEVAKRALTIAAAGNHSVLMTGPPGGGKTLLARAFAGIIPPLSVPAAVEVAAIHSLCGLAQKGVQLQPPFRAPHHTTSMVGLIGGGTPIKPGEISLAHHGVLFLDELPEFPRHCIESLRQPLEERTVTIVRSTATVHLPAECTLIAAANPCPCGYYGSEVKPCHCTPTLREQYQHRLSGPILDRIDLHLHVEGVGIPQLYSTTSPESSVAFRAAVTAARSRQLQRYGKDTTNGKVDTTLFKHVLKLSTAAQTLAISASQKLALSARAHGKLLRVAQSIADLAGAPVITKQHIAEALQYRVYAS